MATNKRHKLSQRFHDILGEIGKLHDKKQADYGRKDNPFANVEASVDFGVPGWVGTMIRANDKMRRIMKAATQAVHEEEISLANEGILDSLQDLATYSIIAQVLLEEELGLVKEPFFEGKIDEVRVWPGVITPNEVQATQFYELKTGLDREIRPHIDVNRAIQAVRARTSRGVDHVFLPDRSVLSEPVITLFGLPVTYDDKLPKNTFCLRVEASASLMEFHYFPFTG